MRLNATIHWNSKLRRNITKRFRKYLRKLIDKLNKIGNPMNPNITKSHMIDSEDLFIKNNYMSIIISAFLGSLPIPDKNVRTSFSKKTYILWFEDLKNIANELSVQLNFSSNNPGVDLSNFINKFYIKISELQEIKKDLMITTRILNYIKNLANLTNK